MDAGGILVGYQVDGSRFQQRVELYSQIGNHVLWGQINAKMFVVTQKMFVVAQQTFVVT